MDRQKRTFEVSGFETKEKIRVTFEEVSAGKAVWPSRTTLFDILVEDLYELNHTDLMVTEGS